MNPKNESFRWKMYKARGTCPGAGEAVSASKEQRMEHLHAQRRHSRWGEMLKRRNIAEGSMSPIYSPCISNEKGVENKQMLTRTKERKELLKWQQEKKKRLEKQKASAKPIFKVHRVSQSATYDLDTVYKQIKGQPIAASSKNNQGSYRLVSSATYKFKPPANIKPMALANKQKLLGSKAKSHTNGSRKQKSPSTQQSTSKTNIVTRTNSRVKNQEPQPSTSGTLPKAKTIKNSIKSSSETSSSPASAIFKSKNDRSTGHQVKGEATSSAEASDKEKEPSLSTKTANPEIAANGVTESSDSDRALTSCNKNIPLNVVYVSPFVTMSRGEDNAQIEYHRRSTPGGSGNIEKQSPYVKHDESKTLLMDQTVRLQSLCEIWNYYKEEHNSQEEVCDMINVAIGQTDLLLQKKSKQFKGLIQCCESEVSERQVTCLELHGFCDTMMIQNEILPLLQTKKKGRPKQQTSKKAATSSSGLKTLIQVARKKKTAEDHNPHLLSVPSTSKLLQDLVFVLTSETQRKLSSAGLTMIKVTQIAKSAEKSAYSTPLEAPRSILKAERTKSSRRKSKVVLFKDTDSSDVDKKNKNSSDLIDFSEDIINKTPV